MPTDQLRKSKTPLLPPVIDLSNPPHITWVAGKLQHQIEDLQQKMDAFYGDFWKATKGTLTTHDNLLKMIIEAICVPTGLIKIEPDPRDPTNKKRYILRVDPEKVLKLKELLESKK